MPKGWHAAYFRAYGWCFAIAACVGGSIGMAIHYAVRDQLAGVIVWSVWAIVNICFTFWLYDRAGSDMRKWIEENV